MTLTIQNKQKKFILTQCGEISEDSTQRLSQKKKMLQKIPLIIDSSAAMMKTRRMCIPHSSKKKITVDLELCTHESVKDKGTIQEF